MKSFRITPAGGLLVACLVAGIVVASLSSGWPGTAGLILAAVGVAGILGPTALSVFGPARSVGPAPPELPPGLGVKPPESLLETQPDERAWRHEREQRERDSR